MPLDAILFHSTNDFYAALPTLEPRLQPKTPIYLILRKGDKANDFVAVTYIPSTAPVRSKTLFASTRATLVRELGAEKFKDTLFVTDAEEVTDQKQWEERERGKNGDTDARLLSTEERELQSVKRAEEEERHGTSGRDLMGGGGSGAQGTGGRGAAGAGASGIRMKITDEAKDALGHLKEGSGGAFVQLGIDLSSETLTLLSSQGNVQASQVNERIPAERPSYTFFHFPGTETVVFIYCCPGSSKVKERMMYASSRNGVIEIAKGEGIAVSKRLEAGAPDEISERRLQDEVGLNVAEETTSSSRQGFSRPKRPGKR